MVRDRLLARLDAAEVREVARRVEAAVLADEMTPDQAASAIIDAIN
jgi:hypothetical protein